MKRAPVRTCVGCRQTAAKADLTRFVLRQDAPVLDALGLEPGRGAYVHAQAVCLDQAMQRGLARSFRRKLDPAGLAALATLDSRFLPKAGRTHDE